jgi:hypothetical protein
MVDFRLYSRALSSSEITQLYTQYNTYTNAIVIPTSTTEIVAGDLGVTGNVVALRNIGIGTTNPQYNLDVSGTVNVSGISSRSYQSLPLFNSPNQVGYTMYGTFVSNFTMASDTVTNLGSFTLPVGIWSLNAQVSLKTGPEITITTTTASIVSISDSQYTAISSTQPFAFSQMYSTLTIGSNANNGYCSNISQIFSNSTDMQSLYLNTQFTGTNLDKVLLDQTRSFFTATRIA